MKLIILTILIILSIASVIGAEINKVAEGDIEWVDPQENTLSLAENFTIDNFVIEATDFYEGSVLITVYDGDESYIPYCKSIIVAKTIAKTGDSWNITDRNNITRMNIFIKELKEIKGNINSYEGLNVVVDQRVNIRTMLVGRPTPIISIIPKERESNNRTFVDRIFIPSSEISINFSIKNEGKATLRRMNLIVNSGGLPILSSDERLIQELPGLKINETRIITIRFRAPNVEKRKNFTISGSITGMDIFGREYNVTDSTDIIVRPYVEKLIEINKYVPEKIYMGDFVYVTLNIKNNGWNEIKGINLTESIPPGFELLDDLASRNITNFTLKGLENKLVVYKLRPKRPGIFVFPTKTSILEWKGGIEYNNKSNKLIVNGPYVELKKSGIVKEENIIITIDAKNLGDMTAIVRLRDLIPKGAAITQSLVVRPGRTATFSYNINKTNVTDIIYDGEVILPHTDAIVLDQYLFTNERYTQKAISNDLILTME